MANYIDNSLLAMQKSLRDVVLPAVDASDPLAREQLSLAIDYLGFLRQRLDQIQPRLRFELNHFSSLARALIRIVGQHDSTRPVSAALDRAAAVSTGESAEALRTAVDELTASIDALVETCCQADSAFRPAVEKAVVEAANTWAELELSWYMPISVAVSATQPRPLSEFLGPAARTRASA